MKHIACLLLAMALVGCSTTVPVTRNFPDVPVELTTACPDLKLAEPSVNLSALVTTVTQNYELYKQCQIKVNAWTKWHQEQKQIFNSVK